MDRKTVSFREQLEASLRKTLSRQKTFKPSEDGVAQTGSAQLVAGLSAEAQEGGVLVARQLIYRASRDSII